MKIDDDRDQWASPVAWVGRHLSEERVSGSERATSTSDAPIPSYLNWLVDLDAVAGGSCNSVGKS